MAPISGCKILLTGATLRLLLQIYSVIVFVPGSNHLMEQWRTEGAWRSLNGVNSHLHIYRGAWRSLKCVNSHLRIYRVGVELSQFVVNTGASQAHSS